MNPLWWKEKKMRSVWKVERSGKTSFLVGTAHFSPYRFERTLTKLIQPAQTVLFEGPLDQESMARVVQYGRQGENSPSIYDALDPGVIREINKQMKGRSSPDTAAGYLPEIIRPTSSNVLESAIQGVRPWMAFFTIWPALLNWNYSMDVEAFQIAQKLGKKIRYLETIEDQLAALDGIPFERMVKYLNHVDHWKAHKDLFMKAFLEGDMEKFISMTGEFPTRCESILKNRDPLFFEGIKASHEEGKTIAFVGVAHIPGITKLFLDEGYRVIQGEP